MSYGTCDCGEEATWLLSTIEYTWLTRGFDRNRILNQSSENSWATCDEHLARASYQQWLRNHGKENTVTILRGLFGSTTLIEDNPTSLERGQ